MDLVLVGLAATPLALPWFKKRIRVVYSNGVVWRRPAVKDTPAMDREHVCVMWCIIVFSTRTRFWILDFSWHERAVTKNHGRATVWLFQVGLLRHYFMQQHRMTVDLLYKCRAWEGACQADCLWPQHSCKVLLLPLCYLQFSRPKKDSLPFRVAFVWLCFACAFLRLKPPTPYFAPWTTAEHNSRVSSWSPLEAFAKKSKITNTAG